jgi:dTDP-4-dehydrorhamnose 3,5-epimerase
VNILTTGIDGVLVAETKMIQDKRGSFGRMFCDHDLTSAIGTRQIKQINKSCTSMIGAIRGLHFQYSPHSEMKMIRCLKGRVWDIALDIRKGSPTFLQWHAQELSSDNALLMIIPEGCAHGFQVLEPDSELLYLHTASYEPSAEGGIRFDDPIINIPWPMPATDLSDRDNHHPLITEEFIGVTL